MTKSNRSEPAKDADKPGRRGRPKASPAGERRGAHRVADDQRTGEGALTAMSRLKMLERQRAEAKAKAVDWRDERDD